MSDVALERCADLWLDDGTVVLKAGAMLFKIYKGILSMNSSVFCDMFTCPQPVGADSYDGCALVEVQDTPHEMRHFLLTLHQAGYFETQSKCDPYVTIGVLRLSSKYDVPFYRERAIDVLSTIYPDNLDKFLKRTPSYYNAKFSGLAAVVVSLARQVDACVLLPLAMFICTVGTITSIVDGMEIEDGTHVELDAADKRLCIIAHSKIRRAWYRDFLHFAIAFEPVCGGWRCRDSASRIQQLKDAISEAEQEHPFALQEPQLTAFIESAAETQHPCGTCRAALQRAHRQEMQRAWDALPSYFSLPSWEEMRASPRGGSEGGPSESSV